MKASSEKQEPSLGNIDVLYLSDAPAITGPGNSPAFGFIISAGELLTER